MQGVAAVCGPESALVVALACRGEEGGALADRGGAGALARVYSTVTVEADELERGGQDACSKGMHFYQALFLRGESVTDRAHHGAAAAAGRRTRACPARQLAHSAAVSLAK
jgi:hypothetical protein